MKGSFNFEFGEGDIRKFIEDLGRRWTLNTIHDVLKHIRDPHLVALLKDALRNGFAAGRTVGRRPPTSEYEEVFVGEQRVASPPPWGPEPPPPYQQPFVGGPIPYSPGPMPPRYPAGPGVPPPFQGPGAPPSFDPDGIADEILNRGAKAPDDLKRCVPIEANQYQDEGWHCHACGFVNGVQRSVCRHCQHERCDDIVTPDGSLS